MLTRSYGGPEVRSIVADTLCTLAIAHTRATRGRIGLLSIALAGCPAAEAATIEAAQETVPASGSEAHEASAALPDPPRTCDPRPTSPQALMDRYFRSTPGTEADGGAEVAHASIRREVIRSTIMDHMDEVQRCQSKAGQPPDGRAGRLVVRFVIGPDGKVANAAIGENETGDTQVPCCVMDAVLGWSFPPPEDGGITVVSYPF